MNKFNVLLCFMLLSLSETYLTVSSSSTHRCQYKSGLVKENITSTIPIKTMPAQSISYQNQVSNQNLRIYLEYTSTFNALPNVNDFKTNIVEPAVTKLQATLKPKIPITDKILVDRHCVNDVAEYLNGDKNQKVCVSGCKPQTICSDVPVPDKFLKKCTYKSGSQYLSSGTDGSSVSNADIIIMVTAQTCAGDTLATASSCFKENTLDRPILGTMVICTSAYQPRFNIQMQINTVMHELIHALGFASDYFAYFRDSNGQPLTPRDSVGEPNLGSSGGNLNFAETVGKKVTRTRKSAIIGTYSKTMNTITLPTVVKEAQSHFGCSSLDGLDLQYISNPNDINSHWDKLVVGNEIMSPNADAGEGVISRITLAFLLDTGWYHVDFNQAGKYTYGSKLGCDFMLKGCLEFMDKQRAKSQALNPFCDEIQNGYKLKCSTDRRYVMNCNMNYDTKLDSKYSYFTTLQNIPAGQDVRYYGGSDGNNEYCPTYTKTLYDQLTSDCNLSINNLRNDSGFQMFREYYATDSKCFDTTNIAWISKGLQVTYWGALCLQSKCNSETKELTVFIDNKEICKTTTTEKIVKHQNSSMEVNIKCPTYDDACLGIVPNFKILSYPNYQLLLTSILFLALLSF